MERSLKGFIGEVRLPDNQTMNLSGQTLDDAQLIEEAIAGSTQAFSDLFNRYYPMIHAFAYRLSLCPTEASDIAQDTFIQAARSLGGFRREASFKNWLYAIAANKSRDRFRQRVRRDQLSADYSTLHSTAQVESAAVGLVREALAGLPQDMREVVALVYYEGLNHAEAARVLGCAETTVSWRIFRAKQKLKPVLQSRMVGGAHE